MPRGVYKRTKEQLVILRKQGFQKGKLAPKYKDGRCLKEHFCIDCGELVTNHRALRCGSCSQKYLKRDFYGENNPNWINGKSFEPYSLLFNQQLKDKIRVRDNFICQLCGVPELECSQRLGIHHIDYNKMNNKMDNLISLCRKCHIKTNYKRDYWINYFKESITITEIKV